MQSRVQVFTVAEKGRAFYFHNFQKRSFPTMVISDYEYFSLPKFLDTDLIVANHKNAQRCASRKELKEAGLFARIGFGSLASSCADSHCTYAHSTLN